MRFLVEDPVNSIQYLAVSIDGTSIVRSLNIGPSITYTSAYKCSIDGSLNSTSLYQNGTLIDFNTYALKSNVDSSLNTIDNKFSQFLP